MRDEYEICRFRMGNGRPDAVFRVIRSVALAMLFSSSMVACSGDSWKEEVQLHDGQKIIVDRSQTYGGRNEIGQSPPVKEHTIKFKLPDSGKTITWTSEYGEDLGRTNFQAVALHILNGAPYLVAAPNLCLAYNKWGRPNPPYVIFKYDGSGWPRIPMAELPAEFKDTNLVVNTKGDAKVLTAKRMVTADFVKKLNLELESPEYKTILRDKLPPGELCPQYSSSPKAPNAIPPSAVAK